MAWEEYLREYIIFALGSLENHKKKKINESDKRKSIVEGTKT